MLEDIYDTLTSHDNLARGELIENEISKSQIGDAE